MSNSNRNKRKLKILTILNYSSKPLLAKEIHELCYPMSLSLTTICSRLLSYVRQGIIKRIKENNVYIKPFLYEITPRGEDKLNYLINVKEQIKLLVREPIRFT